MTDSQIAAAYDARAAEYVALIGDIAQVEAADAVDIARWRDATPGRLLDAGCGPGLWTAFLHESGRDAVGVDLSVEFITAARERHPGIDFQVASFRDLPFDDASFDGILAWYSLIHTPPADLPAVLAELRRVLAPGGGLLIGFFDGEHREPFAHAVTTAFFWSADALSELLGEAGLTVTGTDRRERTLGAVSARPHGAITALHR